MNGDDAAFFAELGVLIRILARWHPGPGKETLRQAQGRPWGTLRFEEDCGCCIKFAFDSLVEAPDHAVTSVLHARREAALPHRIVFMDSAALAVFA